MLEIHAHVAFEIHIYVQKPSKSLLWVLLKG